MSLVRSSTLTRVAIEFDPEEGRFVRADVCYHIGAKDTETGEWVGQPLVQVEQITTETKAGKKQLNDALSIAAVRALEAASDAKFSAEACGKLANAMQKERDDALRSMLDAESEAINCSKLEKATRAELIAEQGRAKTAVAQTARLAELVMVRQSLRARLTAGLWLPKLHHPLNQ